MDKLLITVMWLVIWLLERLEVQRWKRLASQYKTLYIDACDRLVTLSEQIEETNDGERISETI